MFGESKPYSEIKYKHSKEYKKQLWDTSFGLQKVDALTPSRYLIELSQEEINGKKTYQEIEEDIYRYYTSVTADKSSEEADKVSIRIAQWLSHPRTFELSTRRLKQIHGFLFSGISSFHYPAGRFREVNISKEEIVLHGRSVYYEDYTMLDSAFDIDFDEEKRRDYSKLDLEERAKRVMSFISNIWQIHPFREGNTRTVAVYAIEYFRELGFDIDNTLFAQHSDYFRDALVRDNCLLEWQTSYFLDCFTENLVLHGKHDLSHMDLIVNLKENNRYKDEHER